MDSLVDYRNRHAMAYNKRIQEEREKEALIAAANSAEEEKRNIMKNTHDLFIKNITDISIILLVCESASVMQFQLEQLNVSLTNHISTFNITKESEMMKSICTAVLKVFDSVNQNGFSKINFNNLEDVSNSKRICETMNTILSKVGIQHESDSVEVKYEMDCNQDEEIARRLYLEEENIINVLPNNVQQRFVEQNIPNRPVRRPRQPRLPRQPVVIPVVNAQTPAPAQAVQPVQPIIENTNAVQVPRPRGRPRRRNDQII